MWRSRSGSPCLVSRQGSTEPLSDCGRPWRCRRSESMAEEMLRRNLDRAYDPGPDFPSPSLVPQTLASLGAEMLPAGRTRVGWHPAWILPAVAALLALALVTALLISAHALRPRAVQVKQPEFNIPAAGACVDSGGAGRAPDTMTSATTGWSTGPLRTTDGGATWHDVSP